MNRDNNEQRTKEINKTIAKLKKLFKIRENCFLIEKRLGKTMSDKTKRTKKNLLYQFVESFYLKIEDIHDILDNLSNRDKTFTPFKLYKIFKLCLEAINENEYFLDTIGKIQDYNPNTVRKKIEDIRKFIPTLQDKQIRIPRNPNEINHLLFYEFRDKYKLKEDDAKNILSVIYCSEKKAKFPKIIQEGFRDLRDTLQEVIEVGGADKGLTKQEILKKIENLNQRFKHYL